MFNIRCSSLGFPVCKVSLAEKSNSFDKFWELEMLKYAYSEAFYIFNNL